MTSRHHGERIVARAFALNVDQQDDAKFNRMFSGPTRTGEELQCAIGAAIGACTIGLASCVRTIST